MSAVQKEKSSLLEKLEHVFERLEENEKENQQAIKDLQARALQVDQLQTENARLRQDLQSALSKRQISNSKVANVAASEHGLPDSSSGPSSKEYEHLEKKYNKVMRECEQLKVVNNELYTRLSSAQAKLRSWNQYSSPKPRASTDPTNEPLPSQPLEKDGNQGEPSISSSDLPLPPQTTIGPISKPHGLAQAFESRYVQQPVQTPTPGASYSKSTDRAIKAGSSRVSLPDNRQGLKRKLDDVSVPSSPTNGPVRKSGQESDPVIVKSEPSSSSLGELNHSDIPQSSASEDLSRPFRPPTPKRPRSVSRDVQENNSDPSSDDAFEPVLQTPRPRLVSKSAFSTTTPVPRDITEGSSKTSNSTLQALGGNGQFRTPLGTLNTNAKILPRTSGSANTGKRRQAPTAEAVSKLAEDGEYMTPKQNTSRGGSFNEEQENDAKPSVDSYKVHRRLGQLLAKSTREKPILQEPEAAPQPTIGSPIRKSRRSFQEHDSEISTPMGRPSPDDFTTNASKRPLPNNAVSNYNNSTTPRTTASSKMATPRSRPLNEINPNHEPFRAQPLHRLSLEHFKINPARNDGLSYAYSDVVRSRDQRKCLPGCTRPECCGNKFRAIAADLPTTNLASHTNLLSSSPPPEDADLDILLNYLGQSSASQVNHLTPTERTTLLTEAKTKLAADKYGKMHRHAWQPQRPRSPPGFWRTDMPGTQEEEEDRREAEGIVRRMVEERWREALKGAGPKGGRWIFADE